MVEFRLKLAEDFHRKLKASAALDGMTMQQFIVLALDSYVLKPSRQKGKPKTTKRKRG